MKTASVRQLRTEFPKVRDIIEREGEVVVTERGQAAYVIRPYRVVRKRKPAKKDYLARLLDNMPKPISAEASRAIDEMNRGER
ncbi:MAG: type II toxin-antitoxin system Phd/YefM family antitoxin [Opitutaceae bacterium]|nr:type II toxin-antitoxin system Phd/YefM family antitoxin [Opitutaceae bacterium]